MRRILLFAKRPVEGRVKTRLVPPLRRDEALGLYRAFLEDQLAFLRSFAAEARVGLYVDASWGPHEGPETTGLTVRSQGGGDLGRRLSRAFREAAAEGDRETVIFAADAPTLPRRLVREALHRLESGAPAVVAPAADGGYVMIGMRGHRPELFRDVPWGGPDVLRVTLRLAREAGIEVALLERWFDVDDAASLERLRRHLRRPEGRERAPASARFLAALRGV